MWSMRNTALSGWDSLNFQRFKDARQAVLYSYMTGRRVF